MLINDEQRIKKTPLCIPGRGAELTGRGLCQNLAPYKLSGPGLFEYYLTQEKEKSFI